VEADYSNFQRIFRICFLFFSLPFKTGYLRRLPRSPTSSRPLYRALEFRSSGANRAWFFFRRDSSCAYLISLSFLIAFIPPEELYLDFFNSTEFNDGPQSRCVPHLPCQFLGGLIFVIAKVSATPPPLSQPKSCLFLLSTTIFLLRLGRGITCSSPLSVNITHFPSLKTQLFFSLH